MGVICDPRLLICIVFFFALFLTDFEQWDTARSPNASLSEILLAILSLHVRCLCPVDDLIKNSFIQRSRIVNNMSSKPLTNHAIKNKNGL